MVRERIARRAEEFPAHASTHGVSGLSEPFESFERRHEAFEPIALDVPSLEVATSDGYDPPLGDILAFIRS